MFRLIAALCAIIVALGGVAAYALSTQRATPPHATYAQAVRILDDEKVIYDAALTVERADVPPASAGQQLYEAKKATESIIATCRHQPTLIVEKGFGAHRGPATIKEELEGIVNSLRGSTDEWLMKCCEELKLALEQHCG